MSICSVAQTCFCVPGKSGRNTLKRQGRSHWGSQRTFLAWQWQKAEGKQALVTALTKRTLKMEENKPSLLLGSCWAHGNGNVAIGYKENCTERTLDWVSRLQQLSLFRMETDCKPLNFRQVFRTIIRVIFFHIFSTGISHFYTIDNI